MGSLVVILAAVILGFMVTSAIFWSRKPEKGLFLVVWIIDSSVVYGAIILALST